METNELKKIWQTLSNENLIDKKIAKENIERIIKLKSSKTIERLSKKLRFDYLIKVEKLKKQTPVLIPGFIFTIRVFISFSDARTYNIRGELHKPYRQL